MDAVEYIKEYKRMCDSIERDCGICKVYEECLCRGDDPEKWISIVEKWAKEHPKKTRQSEFLKQFPSVHQINGVISIMPCVMDSGIDDACEKAITCEECSRKYWTEEIEE